MKNNRNSSGYLINRNSLAAIKKSESVFFVYLGISCLLANNNQTTWKRVTVAFDERHGVRGAVQNDAHDPTSISTFLKQNIKF